MESGNGNGADMNLNKVHFSTEKDDISLYGTPKEEIVPLSTSRYRKGWPKLDLQNTIMHNY